jgi:Zn-dependent protease with chaperone function
MDSRQSVSFLVGRAMLAIALMAGFYLLALSIAGILAYLPIAELSYAHRIHPKLALFCLISAGVIVWSIIPRFDKFTPPGPQLQPAQNPKLFDLLHRIAGQTQQQMPAEVYLCPDVNAWVAQRGGWMGFGSRRVMGVGLPLLEVFTVGEFGAVLAHEFGHFHGGDTRLGPWIYKTRGMIGRTLAGLGNSVIQKPFLWYGKLYLRITHAVSRRQEYLADELAARTVSPQALISGLKKVHGAALGFQAYLNTEFAPVFSSGLRSPFLEGFTRYRASAKISEAVARSLDSELREGKPSPYDTHPALKDRLAALEAVHAATQWNDDTPALNLISDYKQYETALLAALTGNEKAGELPFVPWEEVGTKVYVPMWKKTLESNAADLKGQTVADVYTLARDPEAFIAKVAGEAAASATLEQKQGATVNILGAALSLALASHGWKVEAELGESIHLNKDSCAIAPFELVVSVVQGKLDRQEWDRLLGESGSLAL